MPYTKRFESTLYNAEWLKRVYVDENRNAAQVAQLADCTTSAVLGALRRHGIAVKDAAEAQRLAPHSGSHAPRPRRAFLTTLHDPEWLRARRHLNASELAREAGCSVPAVQDALRAADLPVPDMSTAMAGRPQPGKRKEHGEPVTRATSSRRANAACPPGPCVLCGGAGEHVNHIDFDWQNNESNNLERLCGACHRQQHAAEQRIAVEMLKALGIEYRTVWQRAREQLRADAFKPGTREPGTLTIDGTTKSIGQWAVDSGLREVTLRQRLRNGWDPVEAVSTPARKHEQVEFEGVVDSITGHAIRRGLNPANVFSRLQQDWSLERALKTPIREPIPTAEVNTDEP